jgi:cell division protein ZapA (FtsZ GTPase activity inhibitor)
MANMVNALQRIKDDLDKEIDSAEMRGRELEEQVRGINQLIRSLISDRTAIVRGINVVHERGE